jgi:hypothetical protein
LYRSVLKVELLATVLSLVMQDGPFLCVRLYTSITYQVVTYSLVFFTAKNMLVILLLLYKILLLLNKLCCPRRHHHGDGKGEDGEKDDTNLGVGFFNYRGSDPRNFERVVSFPQFYEMKDGKVVAVDGVELRRRKDSGVEEPSRPLSMEPNAFSDWEKGKLGPCSCERSRTLCDSSTQTGGEAFGNGSAKLPEHSKALSVASGEPSSSGYTSESNRASTSEDEDLPAARPRSDGEERRKSSTSADQGRSLTPAETGEELAGKGQKRDSKQSEKEVRFEEVKTEKNGTATLSKDQKTKEEDGESNGPTLPDLHSVIEGPATPAKPMEKAKKYDKLMENSEKKSKKEKQKEEEEEKAKKAGDDDEVLVEDSARMAEKGDSAEPNTEASLATNTSMPFSSAGDSYSPSSTFSQEAKSATDVPHQPPATEPAKKGDNYGPEDFFPQDAFAAADMPGEDEVKKMTELLDAISNDSDDSEEISDLPPPYHPSKNYIHPVSDRAYPSHRPHPNPDNSVHETVPESFLNPAAGLTARHPPRTYYTPPPSSTSPTPANSSSVSASPHSTTRTFIHTFPNSVVRPARSPATTRSSAAPNPATKPTVLGRSSPGESVPGGQHGQFVSKFQI